MITIEKSIETFDREYAYTVTDYRKDIERELMAMARGAADSGFYTASIVYTTALSAAQETYSGCSVVHAVFNTAESEYNAIVSGEHGEYEKRIAIKQILRLVENICYKARNGYK